MLRASNYSVITSPEGAIEQDSFTCGHCQRVVLVKPKQRPEDLGGLCKICVRLICPKCVDESAKATDPKDVCKPFEERLREIEERDRFRRQAGL